MLPQTNHHIRARLGMTGMQVILTLAVLSIGVMVILVMLNNLSHNNRSTRCRANLLMTANGIDLFKNDHHQSTPLPSVENQQLNLQLGHLTLTDATADFHLFMIMNRYYPAHIIICPGEKNPIVHALNEESLASVKPGDFRADIDGGRNRKSWSNVSYANQFPARINNQPLPPAHPAPDAIPLLADRGPKDGIRQPSSYSYQLHGSQNLWQGNLIFADHHITILREQQNIDYPFSLSHLLESNTRSATSFDNIFYHDHDQQNQTSDLFLGLFRNSNTTPNRLLPVWD